MNQQLRLNKFLAERLGVSRREADELIAAGKITIDGTAYLLHEGESIVMPAGHPHAVYGEEQFKMLLTVIF